ncbi:MAG TPA: hypothetical protein VGK19_08880 [Capsulimonadaceae bacterium]|jgi:hypothetical protein
MIRLTNFQFVFENGFAIKLENTSKIYDLHNRGLFQGFYYNTADNELQMYWWFNEDPDVITVNPGYGFELVMRGVDYLEVAPRDPEMPSNENETLSAISYMFHDDNLADFLHNGMIPVYRPEVNPSEQFHLLFIFRGGLMIRVNAAEAEFVVRAV